MVVTKRGRHVFNMVAYNDDLITSPRKMYTGKTLVKNMRAILKSISKVQTL